MFEAGAPHFPVAELFPFTLSRTCRQHNLYTKKNCVCDDDCRWKDKFHFISRFDFARNASQKMPYAEADRNLLWLSVPQTKCSDAGVGGKLKRNLQMFIQYSFCWRFFFSCYLEESTFGVWKGLTSWQKRPEAQLQHTELCIICMVRESLYLAKRS